MVSVALLSNPRSTGNQAVLPQIRSYCATRPDIFHYEVENADQTGTALTAIARVRPRVLVINGGDGTVQAALTELFHGDHFRGKLPPVAVLPNGKTNLIALDLGAVGDPLAALERIVELARTGMDDHLVARSLIALTEGEHSNRPVLGMFLGGAGLADTILFCRERIYPLGLPNGLSHAIAGIATLLALVIGIRASFLPPRPNAVRVSLLRDGQIAGRFAFLIVTTLEKLLLGCKPASDGRNLKLFAVEQSAWALLRAVFAGLFGQLGKRDMRGIHVEQGDLIRIESERTSVILDGEEFHAISGRPIVLRSTPPMHFLRLAA